jgi:hypothetical protein
VTFSAFQSNLTMTEKPMGERIAVLEEQVRAMASASAARATREWGIIMAVFALVATVFGKSIGAL